MTIGDFITAVLAIDSEEKARAFFDVSVDELRQAGQAAPEDIVRSNIGWCFGEGMAPERRAMWRETLGVTHPALGPMVEDPSPDDCLRAGIEAAGRLPAQTPSS